MKYVLFLFLGGCGLAQASPKRPCQVPSDCGFNAVCSGQGHCACPVGLEWNAEEIDCVKRVCKEDTECWTWSYTHCVNGSESSPNVPMCVCIAGRTHSADHLTCVLTDGLQAVIWLGVIVGVAVVCCICCYCFSVCLASAEHKLKSPSPTAPKGPDGQGPRATDQLAAAAKPKMATLPKYHKALKGVAPPSPPTTLGKQSKQPNSGSSLKVKLLKSNATIRPSRLSMKSRHSRGGGAGAGGGNQGLQQVVLHIPSKTLMRVTSRHSGRVPGSLPYSLRVTPHQQQQRERERSLKRKERKPQEPKQEQKGAFLASSNARQQQPHSPDPIMASMAEPSPCSPAPDRATSLPHPPPPPPPFQPFAPSTTGGKAAANSSSTAATPTAISGTKQGTAAAPNGGPLLVPGPMPNPSASSLATQRTIGTKKAAAPAAPASAAKEQPRPPPAKDGQKQ